jgi:hypothetical protein
MLCLMVEGRGERGGKGEGRGASLSSYLRDHQPRRSITRHILDGIPSSAVIHSHSTAIPQPAIPRMGRLMTSVSPDPGEWWVGGERRRAR